MPSLVVKAGSTGIAEADKFGVYRANADPFYGRSIDGDANVASGKNPCVEILGTASGSPARTVDAARTTVTAITGAVLSVASTTDFRVGDFGLLINMRGNSTRFAQVGFHEVVKINSIGGGSITLASAPTKIYGQDGSLVPTNSDLTGQSIVLQRIPEYGTVIGGGSINAPAWDGTSGGIVAFMCHTLAMTNGIGTITAGDLGYRGGTSAPVTGNFGEGYKNSAGNDNGGAGFSGSFTGGANAVASGGGGGAQGWPGGGWGSNKVAGPNGLIGTGGGGGGGGAPGPFTVGGTGSQVSSGFPAPSGAGGTNNSNPSGGGGGSVVPGTAGAAAVLGFSDILDTNRVLMGGGGGRGPQGTTIGGNGSTGGGNGGGSTAGPAPAIRNGGGLIFIWAKNITTTIVIDCSSSPSTAAAGSNGAAGTANNGGGGGGGGASGGPGGGAGGSIVVISNKATASSLTANCSARVGAAGGTGGSANGTGAAGGNGGAITSTPATSTGRMFVRYIVDGTGLVYASNANDGTAYNGTPAIQAAL